MHKPVFSSSHVYTSPAPVVLTLNLSLTLHVYDVPVPANLLCHVRKVPPPIPLSANLTTTPDLMLSLKISSLSSTINYRTKEVSFL